MRFARNLGLSLLALGWMVSCCAAQSAAEQSSSQPAADAAQKAEAEQASQPTAAELRAQLHRAMAELIEAQSVSQPDQKKVEELAARIRELRGELLGQVSVPGSVPPRAGRCPWGNVPPGMGLAARYGAGFGAGRVGPQWNQPAGGGYGRGPAARGGWSRGRGGVGMGRGAGFRSGAYVDANRNGVCDNYEAIGGRR